jgi:hypothetical protein
MLEAEKLESLRPQSMPAPHGGGKATKEQQPSLVLGQLQIELRKTFPQLVLEHLRIIPELKAPNEVISETHQVRSPRHCDLNFFSNHRSSVKCK